MLSEVGENGVSEVGAFLPLESGVSKGKVEGRCPAIRVDQLYYVTAEQVQRFDFLIVWLNKRGDMTE
jgi:hypothetical protein